MKMIEVLGLKIAVLYPSYYTRSDAFNILKEALSLTDTDIHLGYALGSSSLYTLEEPKETYLFFRINMFSRGYLNTILRGRRLDQIIVIDFHMEDKDKEILSSILYTSCVPYDYQILTLSTDTEGRYINERGSIHKV